ncbi:MAG TPA: hypothetical protein VL475_15945 [Planctomycetaceae bacterium]|nr:hypothetical protein [Planctomycetaceae bacterium]
MTNSTKRPADSSPDDPWEQLAEDLFGLEFGKEHAATGAADAVTEAETVVPAPPMAESPVIREIIEETALPAEPPAAREPESPQFAPADKVAEIPVRPATPSAQDSYWDALANWKWDDNEGPGGKGKHAEPRREASRGGRPQPRQESRSAPSGERPARPAAAPSSPPVGSRSGKGDETGDFGLGVDSSAPGWEKPASTGSDRDQFQSENEAAESEDFGDVEDFGDEEATSEAGEAAGPGTGDENGPRKRRRRRRRRRSRNGEGQPAAGAAPGAPGPTPGADWEKPSEPAKARSEERPRAPEEGGRERERGDEESRPPRRGRRDRRGSGAPVADERHEFSDDEFGVLSTTDEPVSSGGDVGADLEADDDGDLGEPFVNYADVPTWEEAISYLLHPNQVQVESNGGSGSGPGGGPAGEQPRQTRHYGGRRR